MQRESNAAARLADINAWLTERLPDDRPLDRGELREVAGALGARHELWEDLVHHDPADRYYIQLHRDPHLDIWLICWVNQQDTGFHDHDQSQGAVYVCDGVIAEDRFTVTAEGLLETTLERRPGDVFDFDATYIHRMRHPEAPDSVPATSIHCYSPALWRMGYYEPDEAGNLNRNSITYVDEMGPGINSGGAASALR